VTPSKGRFERPTTGFEVGAGLYVDGQRPEGQMPNIAKGVLSCT